MKRRNFVKTTALGAAAAGLGCTTGLRKRRIKPTPGKMIYSVFGKTGLKVSRLSYGSHLTKENMENPAGRDRQIQFACDMGINLFDVYESMYKQYVPMGKSLKNRLNTYISLYCSVEDIDWVLETLGRDHIDLYRTMGNENEIPKLEKLMEYREQGKIRFVGIAEHKVELIVSLAKKYGDDLDFFMFPYNFVHNRATPKQQTNDYTEFMKLAKKHDYGLIGMKPFCNEMLLDFAREYGYVGGPKDRGVNVPAAMLRYNLASGAIHTSMPAMNSVKEVEENLQAIYRPEITDHEIVILKEIDKLAAENKWSYLDKKPGYRWLANWAEPGIYIT